MRGQVQQLLVKFKEMKARNAVLVREGAEEKAALHVLQKEHDELLSSMAAKDEHCLSLSDRISQLEGPP